jgi:hypothetical protein
MVYCRYCAQSGKPYKFSAFDFKINEKSFTKINELDELTNMKYTTAITKDGAIAAIRSKQFIVGSISDTGAFSFSADPKLHPTQSAARTECNRLAKLSPGKLYIFVQLQGAEMLPQPVATISI